MVGDADEYNKNICIHRFGYFRSRFISQYTAIEIFQWHTHAREMPTIAKWHFVDLMGDIFRSHGVNSKYEQRSTNLWTEGE